MILSIKYLPFTPSFPYYHDLSSSYSRFIASFAHFDGIHYLRLIKKGYDDTGSQAFFPFYPMLVKAFTFGYLDPLYVALILNFSFTIGSLIILTQQLAQTTKIKFLLLFLSFPASFFLFMNYTESSFLFLVVLFFALLKNKKYFWASVVAGVASSTRLAGSLLSLSLLVELWEARYHLGRSLCLLFTSVLGLICYLIYLTGAFNDPLMFVHVQSLFGNSRSGGQIILLPQVIFRYLKILFINSPTTLSYFRSLYELLIFVFSLSMVFLLRQKITRSALTFCLFAILLPSLSGTLTSFPRYLLPLTPLFAGLADNTSGKVITAISLVQYVILIIAVALFVQGVFVS